MPILIQIRWLTPSPSVHHPFHLNMWLNSAAVLSLLLAMRSALASDVALAIVDLSPRPDGIGIKGQVLDSSERKDIAAQLVALRGIGDWDYTSTRVVRHFIFLFPLRNNYNLWLTGH